MGPSKHLLALASLLSWASFAGADPFPELRHDRTIAVCFKDSAIPGHVLVHVEYRLDLPEAMAILDMGQYRDEVDPGLFGQKGLEFYAQFARIHGAIIANNLLVEVNGESVSLAEIDALRSQTLDDEKGHPLGHLRCTFHYQVELPIQPAREYAFRLRERNFRKDLKGLVYLSLVNQSRIEIVRQTLPDPDLVERQAKEVLIAGDDRLRELSVQFVGQTFLSAVDSGRQECLPHENVLTPEPTPSPPEDDGFLRTFRDLRQSNAGLWLMLLVFAGLGAAHALTPGHGKALVAAYLVGQRGTLWHALVLGLVTTITHTGVVLAIALALFFSDQARQTIQTGLALVLGLSVTCLGFWLLLKRLSGGADHVHIGAKGLSPLLPFSPSPPLPHLGWRGIIILGMSGGMIPCWDAVAILMMMIGSSEFWLALPALLAFSAGLAGVLVLIGVLVVQFRNFAGSHWGEGRLVRSLPIVSAVLVTAMGLYLCYESVHGR